MTHVYYAKDLANMRDVVSEDFEAILLELDRWHEDAPKELRDQLMSEDLMTLEPGELESWYGIKLDYGPRKEFPGARELVLEQ